MSAVKEQFRIGELARRAGATPRAVRYYEELGLLPERGRPRGGHRMYDERDEERLKELLHIKELLGLSLGELRAWSEAEAARAGAARALAQRRGGRRRDAPGHRAGGAAAHRDAARARRVAPRRARGARGRADREAPAHARDPARARRRGRVSTTRRTAPSARPRTRPRRGRIATSGSRSRTRRSAMLITTINSSIVLIALPDIFRGIHLDPLLPGNTSYLLWMMMGFMVATAVLVVTFGRIGDMYGRVRMFNLGLAVFTVCSILLSVTWMQRLVGRALADRDAHRPGRRRRARDGQLVGDPDRRLPAASSAASRSASTPSPPSRARSSASCSAACSRRSRGASCSSCPCRSACSARSGRTGSCRSAASAGRRASTGGATRRSPSG